MRARFGANHFFGILVAKTSCSDDLTICKNGHPKKRIKSHHYPIRTAPGVSFQGLLYKTLSDVCLPTINGCFWFPLIGGRWHISPQLAVYTTYILPVGWLYATYHLLGEPETTIDTITPPKLPSFGRKKDHTSGQITIIHQPELRGFWGNSLTKTNMRSLWFAQYIEHLGIC